MDHVKTISFAIAFLGLTVMAIVHIVLHVRFVLFLKKKHPELWRMLGCPAPFLGNTPKQCLALSRFIRKGMYFESNDPVMIKEGGLLRVFTRIYLVFFILVVFVFALLLRQWKP